MNGPRFKLCLVYILFGFAAWFLQAEITWAENDNSKPNILFIFADDQCFETINALGDKTISTPNLDRLARSGTSFTNTYNMGSWSGAVCVASRTMLNTGKFVWRAKTNPHKQMIENQQTWAQLMSGAGYETYMTGKWHVGPIKPQKVFDNVVHVRPGMPNQTAAGYVRPIEGKVDQWSPYDKQFNGFWKDGKHWSEVLADDAETFLEKAASDDKPFFMYLAFNAPHDPRQSPKAFVDMYPPESVKMPKTFLPEYPYKQEIGCYSVGGKNGKRLLRDENLAPFPRTEYAVKVNRGEYYALITHMDQQIGRILEALKKTGKQDNTYIFFTADHGLACGHHGLLGKQNMYEHSMKPPMIVAGPTIPKNETRDALIYLQDVMPTTLELAGGEKPEHIEFNSLIPLIDDAEKPGFYDAIYGCYLEDKQRMIRVGDWKLMAYPLAKRLRLYNLADDPQEMQDVSGNPENATRVKNMFNQLVNLCADMDDALDLTKYFPATD